MSGGSPLWRAILWTERFLPTPPTPPAEPSRAAKRRAVLVVHFILLAIAMTGVLRHRQEIGGLTRQYHGALEQLMLVLAVCVAVAAIGFGVKAWRDAGRAR